MRCADWGCALVLFGIALVALGASRVGSGPLFTEPSGNKAGGIVLIVIIGAIVLLVALIVRHFILANAIRRLGRQE